MNIQHSFRTDEWYTPMHIIELVHRVLTSIDLDPASSTQANLRIRAKHIITKDEDALCTPWGHAGTIFLNPPGGKEGNRSKAALFWRKLSLLYEAGFVENAIFMGFSLEQLQTTQDGQGKSICDYTFCVPKKRLRFVTPDGKEADAPSHSNVIAFLGNSIVRNKFCKNFQEIGAVVNGSA